jgi:hypothetical protein
MEEEKTVWSPLCGKLKAGNNHLEIFTVGGNTILKRILQTYNAKAWIVFIWLMLGTSGGLL